VAIAGRSGTRHREEGRAADGSQPIGHAHAASAAGRADWIGVVTVGSRRVRLTGAGRRRRGASVPVIEIQSTKAMEGLAGVFFGGVEPGQTQSPGRARRQPGRSRPPYLLIGTRASLESP